MAAGMSNYTAKTVLAAGMKTYTADTVLMGLRSPPNSGTISTIL
jgi:hypothetical protein